MPRSHFQHVRAWVFDLDNTLYPPSARLFDQIETRMTDFITRGLGIGAAEAGRLRAQYWRDHGTTLAGLMVNHGIDADDFLHRVHDIDLSALTPDGTLAGHIAALPGRKIVFTNGSRGHGERVTRARGLEGAFDAIYGIEDAGYCPKPHAESFRQIFAQAAIDPETAAMFEDEPRNLEVPHQLGMATVLVGNGETAPHVHHRTDDLPGFLARLS